MTSERALAVHLAHEVDKRERHKREAAARKAGDGAATPQQALMHAAEPERELTPNEQYIAEHCRWSRRGPRDLPQRPYGQCMVEYDVLTGEVIGDEDEEAEW